jgi:4-hydroxybenzoate-CoA ligase
MINAEDLPPRRTYNAVVDFVDVNVSRGLGDKAAFVDPVRELTYGELQATTWRFARALRTLGLRQESRIVLLLLDQVEFPIAFWAAIRAGIVPVPLSNQLQTEQYAFILEDCRAEVMVVSRPLFEVIEPVVERLSYLKTIIVVGGEDAATPKRGHLVAHRFEDVLARDAPDPFKVTTLSDEVAFWLYSSGSTGDPKGVKHVHTTMLATARHFGQETLGIGRDDVVFSAGKLFFAYGLANSMAFPMSVGATTVLVPDPATPSIVIETMRRYRPTVFFGGPALYSALLLHKDIGPGAGSDRLRLCASGGDTLPASVGEHWRSIVGFDIVEGAGATEMLTFLSNRPDDIRYGTPGKPLPGYDVKVLDTDGNELGVGQVGELVVRGPTAAEGYWNQRVRSQRTFVGEWVHTGDMYLRDVDGSCYFHGRNDDMFKVGGTWVSPLVLESALLAHEAVLAAAVVGHKDNDGLLKPKAFVVLKGEHKGSADLVQTLKTHVRERLVARFAKASSQSFYAYYPRWIEFRRDLPMTATGKIQRYKLRDEDGAIPS